MASGSGTKADDLAQAGTAQTTAANALSTVNPIYQQWATNPVGYTPQQKAELQTASDQALGGGVAAATGQAGLVAARTGNIGGQTAALDDASRVAGVTQSQNDLGVDEQSDELARQQQLQGVNGINGIYTTALQNGLGYMNSANNTQKPFWQQLATSVLAPAASAYSTYEDHK